MLDWIFGIKILRFKSHSAQVPAKKSMLSTSMPPKPPDSTVPGKKPSGVLLLKNPKEEGNPFNWYSTQVAGIPFILRNLLTMQRAGIKTLAVFMENPDKDIHTAFKNILMDPRFSQKIIWIPDIPEFKEWIRNNPDPIYIFNGSFLYDKKEIFSLIHSEPKTALEAAFPIDPENLNDLLLEQQINLAHQNPEESSGFPFYVPGSPEYEIQKPEDFKILHDTQLGKSGLSHDSAMTQILSRPVSRFLTRIFINTPVTPNQITLIGFFFGLISAFLFFKGSYETSVAASILLVFSAWIDGADGEIARLKFMETDIGKKLDIYCDNIIHFLVFTAIGCGIFTKTGDVIFLYLGGLAGLGGLLSFFALRPALLKKPPGKQLFHTGGLELAGKLANRDFVHFLLLFSLTGQLEIFIAAAAAGANLFAGYLIYSRIIKLKTFWK